ncbi:T9SS type A sorting domain-containing protein [Balneolales bacterium ANBcel1]|nr:T9SS type A sorting domain-containing protein [Balneolales bacterium ANBcel1]
MNTNTNKRKRSGQHTFRGAFCFRWMAACLPLIFLFSLSMADRADGQARIISLSGKQLNIAEFQQTGASVHEKDSLALVAYYNSTNGDQWRDNSGWLVDQVAFWIGIDEIEEVADGEWRVTSVDMPRNNMRVPGPFPPEMEDLEYVWFWKSDVNLHSGPIPPEIARMARLEELLIRTNILTGAVPWEDFAVMPTMEEFRVRQNYLTGEMPAVLGANGEWPVLRRIFLDANLIKGQIPQVDESMQSLNQVYLHDLQLTGPIPDWSHIDEMEYYRIGNNNLDPGPVPDWIGDAWSETLVRFMIQNTNRTGSFPSWMPMMENLEQFVVGGIEDEIGAGETFFDIPDLSDMPSLRRIRIHGGQWSGDFSAFEWMGTAPTLEDIELFNLDLTGNIPANLAMPDNITRIWLQSLNIEGTIPDQFQLADGLEDFRIIDCPNMTIGPIPNFIGAMMGNIENLQLAGVGLTGSIPNNLNNLNLSVLNLRDNPDLTGELPTWLGNKSLTVLNLSRTGLQVDEIPQWITNFRNLQNIGLAGLGISGELPEYFGQGDLALTLSTIALDENNFTGSIPASWGNIQQLDSLNLAYNQLTGEIPEVLAEAGHIAEGLHLLEALVLSGNEGLTGEIPMAFTNASFMRVMKYDGTGLCGPDDASYQNWLDGMQATAATTYPVSYHSVRFPDGCPESPPTSANPTEQAYRFHLHNNYPNPFNPATNIRYEVPEAAHVSLVVYNVIGQRVATIVNEHREAGSHLVTFDATNLASGTYIYRLQAGQRTQTQTMMLVK